MGISGIGLGEMSSKDFYKGRIKVEREAEDGEQQELKENISGLELKNEIRKLILDKGYQFSERQLDEALRDLGIEDEQYYIRKQIMENVKTYFEERRKRIKKQVSL